VELTIGEVFEALFAPGRPEEEDGARAYPSFEDRRWFRRPAPSVSLAPSARSIPDLQIADELLRKQVTEAAPRWREKSVGHHADDSDGSEEPLPSEGQAAAILDAAGKPVSYDPLRHLPPRMPYDVFAIAAHLIDAAGVYHHLQPIKAACEADGDPPSHSSTSCLTAIA
jgi:hypothetical protein